MTPSYPQNRVIAEEINLPVRVAEDPLTAVARGTGVFLEKIRDLRRIPHPADRVREFAGAGQVRNSFSGLEDSDTIPSVGLGLRFLVQQAQHINLRLDYARSEDEDAIYFFVGEAF